MIVIGVDVHKHTSTAVAVDEFGRPLEELAATSVEELLAWASRLSGLRLWALEDCRHVTRNLEQALIDSGEALVRVPPRLTAPERRRGRSRGKSDRIDALAIARAALREPSLDSPRPGEATVRELKLLVDHRDDLVDERRRCQQRLRWHLHELDPALSVPLGHSFLRSILGVSGVIRAGAETHRTSDDFGAPTVEDRFEAVISRRVSGRRPRRTP
jgi:transposase